MTDWQKKQQQGAAYNKMMSGMLDRLAQGAVMDDRDKVLMQSHTIRAGMVRNMIQTGLTLKEELDGVRIDPSEYVRLVELASSSPVTED